MLDTSGNHRQVSTLDDFCSALGFSRQKIDEDISNLYKLGEDFLETSQRLGLDYRGNFANCLKKLKRKLWTRIIQTPPIRKS